MNALQKPRRRRSAIWLEPVERRLLLSTVTWTNKAGGNWATATNWSTGVVPGSGDTVIINQPGAIKVTVSSAVAAGSVQVTGDTLEVSAGTLSIGSSSTINSAATLLLDGGSVSLTGNLTNTGTVTVKPASKLSVSGSISQSGTLNMPDGASTTGVGQNLLGNFDFEQPSVGTNTTTNPNVWGNWNTSYDSTQYAFTGTQSLMESGANSGVYQSFTVTPGVTYTLAVYGMTPAASKLSGKEEALINLGFTNSTGAQLSGGAGVTALNASSAAGGSLTGSVGSQGWNLYTVTVKAPANAVTLTLDLQVGAYSSLSGTTGGTVYWDDAQLGPQGYSSAAVSAASLTNSGTLAIGAADTVSLSGAFSQSATGSLSVQLGGPAAGLDYGSITAAGSATLNGTFTASLDNGYTPTISDGFNILKYSGETGSFAGTTIPSSTSFAFRSAVGPFDFGISAVPPTLTSTINASTTVAAVSPDVAGTNLAYWDSQLNTSQTQQLVTASGMNMFRFPGGSGSDGYHFNTVNSQGIAQFAKLIQSVSGTGVVTTDYGSGSPQEAEAELAYLEGSPSDNTVIGSGLQWSDSANAWQTVNWQTVGYWASLRAASPLASNDGLNFLRVAETAPFSKITYWEIGNEEYGSWETDHHGTVGPGGVSTGSQHDPGTYVNFAEAFASFVAADQSMLPTIHIGIDSGDPTGSTDNNWTKSVLADGAAIGFTPAFISDHNYAQGPGSESDSFLLNDTVSDVGSTLSWATRYTDYESMLNSVDGTAAAAKVQIMATEFNSNYGVEGKQMTSIVNGLYVADSIGSLLTAGYSAGLYWDLRNGWTTSGNNSPSLYGWRQGGDEGLLGDPNTTNDAPITGQNIPYPSYFGEQLASKIAMAGGEVVSASSNYGELATYSVLEPNGHLDLLVINKNPDADLTDQFALSNFNTSGAATIWRYGEAEDYAQSRSTNGAASLTTSSATLPVSSGSFSYTFPAYSMTVIDLSAKPTVVTAAAATLDPSTGTTAALTVAGSENGNAAGLTYTWAATLLPAGAASPTFSANGTNAASNTTATFSAAGNYTFVVTIADSAGAMTTSSVNVTVVSTPPQVSSIVINNGAAQRSMVTSATIAFSQPVTLSSNAVTIALHPSSADASTIGTLPSLAWSSPDGGTTWVVTFAGNGVVGGSIANGMYDLTVNASLVQNSLTTPMTANVTTSFLRLFGDSDGDGTVNLKDYRLFISNYLTSTGQATYNPIFDINGDGTVNLLDYRAFISDYLTTLTL